MDVSYMFSLHFMGVSKVFHEYIMGVLRVAAMTAVHKTNLFLIESSLEHPWRPKKLHLKHPILLKCPWHIREKSFKRPWNIHETTTYTKIYIFHLTRIVNYKKKLQFWSHWACYFVPSFSHKSRHFSHSRKISVNKTWVFRVKPFSFAVISETGTSISIYLFIN